MNFYTNKTNYFFVFLKKPLNLHPQITNARYLRIKSKNLPASLFYKQIIKRL